MATAAPALRLVGIAPEADVSLAWFGNAAKMRVIRQIAADRSPRVVFDYGAGDGRGWRSVLNERPEIRLICYEPNPASAKALRRRNVGVVYEGDPAEIAEQADIIVSFSVFEHVYDRAAYLARARRLLKPGGRFFLNYDDGHFRAPGSRLEALRNLLAPILPHIGMVRHYQSRVKAPDADRLIAAAGFTVVADRFENLPCLKALAKTVPEHARAAFAEQWLDIEDRLNRQLGCELEPVMLSRTMELV